MTNKPKSHFTLSVTCFCALLLMLSFISVGCHDSERDEDIETLTAKEMALAYHIMDDAWREVHRIALQDILIGSPDSLTIDNFGLNTCVEQFSVSDTVAIFPLIMSIKYGFKDYQIRDSAKICDDGFERSGFIYASFSGKYLNKGSEIEITFDDYSKDGFTVEGTSRLTNLGLNSNGYMHFLWEVQDCRITSTNTDFTWEGTHTNIWVAGRSTTDQGAVDDDVVLITGISQGRNSRGNTFFNEITSSYTSDLSCQWFTAGRSELDIPNLEARSINFGDKTKCDNILIERRNNTYFDVEIPY
tara:strand:+ start:1428 stop:2330 length:903 start_codon:yes stop_codon:yes gene_type:complete